MLPTPAHDGVRLFLPTFFFLAAFSGLGGDLAGRYPGEAGSSTSGWLRLAVTGVVLGSAAFALVRIHPYELSYYNELIGGPRGAWERGFELTYWYDAFTDKVIADLNRKFPPRAYVDFLNPNTKDSVIVFQELQTLGALRGDIRLIRDQSNKFNFPYVWLLTHDSKSTALTRLLFAMRPGTPASRRRSTARGCLTVANPDALARAWALQLLLDAPDLSPDDPPAAPAWVQLHAPWLARLWGEGLIKPKKLTLNQTVLDWSRSDPQSLLQAAKWIAAGRPPGKNPHARRLMDQIWMTGDPNPGNLRFRKDLAEQLLGEHSQALVEAVQILNAHRDEVVKVMSRYNYTDPRSLGGYLDRDLAASPEHSASGG